eukprot:scaffold137351_cov35-Tisochrysis_lutea.AAC.2
MVRSVWQQVWTLSSSDECSCNVRYVSSACVVHRQRPGRTCPARCVHLNAGGESAGATSSAVSPPRLSRSNHAAAVLPCAP